MTLDINTQQFSDAIRAASEHLNIAAIYIEKDYWITKILQQLSKTPQGLEGWDFIVKGIWTYRSILK